MRHVLSCALLCTVALLTSSQARAADLVDAVNELRAQGCGREPGGLSAVRPSVALDEVARQWSRGGRLSAALERSAYVATSSASVHLEGSTETPVLARVLREQYCAIVSNPVFVEIGVHRQGAHTWLVLAAPFAPPDPADLDVVAREVLERVNAARGQARRCGRKRHAATHPLALSAALSQVALGHARDMAAHGTLGHRGSDDSSAAERVLRSGYAWRATAENVAAGQPTAEAVVAHWLESPGHCANLMGAEYTEMGVAFAVDPKSKGRIYWAQVFATPR
jgi:uncharacterized protein YkwD